MNPETDGPVRAAALAVARTIVLAATACAAAGCASVTVDADGTRHVTGLVRLTLPPAGLHAGADALRVQALGLQFIHSPRVGDSLVLGYGDVRLTVLRDDARVFLVDAADAGPAARRPLPEETR